MDDTLAITRCREGEKEAFHSLVETYQAEAIGHAVAILGNREDALDMVQEAFIDAYKALDRFDLARRFYPWFYTLLRNRCYKLLAGRSGRELYSLEECEILLLAGAPRPEETLGLERALLDLSPEDREIITLRHLDGLSYDELAERLAVPKGTVMSRLYYARSRLRGKLIFHSVRDLGGA
jgi:RNA polymerase sigma-70 factor, ECF subfamily